MNDSRRHECEYGRVVATNVNMVATNVNMVATNVNMVATNVNIVATNVNIVATNVWHRPRDRRANVDRRSHFALEFAVDRQKCGD